jgi:hypothetical protein
MEQGLEVEGSRLETDVQTNDEKATPAVTQSSYRRGKSFEGYEERA